MRVAARRYPLYSGGASLVQREPFRRLTPSEAVSEATLRDGGRLYVKSRDFIGRAILLTGDYDPKLTWLCRRLLRPGDTVLDVGANHGVITAYAARLVGPSGVVHAFEPQPELALLMRRSMVLNDYRQVTVHALALSDINGSLPLFGSVASSATASLEPPASGQASIGTVTVRRAGEVLESLALGPIRFVKLDIEGHEESFLDGARAYLRASPPDAVAFESHGNAPFTTRPVVRILSELGYVMYQVPKALFSMRLVAMNGDDVARGFDFVGLRPGTSLSRQGPVAGRPGAR